MKKSLALSVLGMLLLVVIVTGCEKAVLEPADDADQESEGSDDTDTDTLLPGGAQSAEGRIDITIANGKGHITGTVNDITADYYVPSEDIDVIIFDASKYWGLKLAETRTIAFIDGKTYAEASQVIKTTTADGQEVIIETEDREIPVSAKSDGWGQEEFPEGGHIVKILMTQANTAQFSPQEISIATGETITWVNLMEYLSRGARVRVTSHHSEFSSPQLKYNESFSFTFTEPGTVTYGSSPYTEYFDIGTIIIS